MTGKGFGYAGSPRSWCSTLSSAFRMLSVLSTSREAQGQAASPDRWARQAAHHFNSAKPIKPPGHRPQVRKQAQDVPLELEDDHQPSRAVSF